MKNMYDIRMLCKVVNLHHSVYYYHKQNRKIVIKLQILNQIRKLKKNLKNLRKDMVRPKSQKL